MPHLFRRHVMSAVGAATTAVALVTLVGCGPPGSGSARAGASLPTSQGSATDATATVRTTDETFRRLESEYHVRLGVFALDTGTNRVVAWRDGERFAFASTFKMLTCGVIMKRESGQGLAMVLTYTAADLQDNSPITRQHVGSGMTVSELCDAALRYSDNTAANVLLVKELGGPAALTADLRKLGDSTTRVDRLEPALSDAVPDDPRDTTTPRAIATDMRGLVLGDILPDEARATFTNMMVHNTTGGTLIRAAVSPDWPVADKTGTGGYGGRNDVGVVWPPGRAPIVLAIMSAHDVKDAPRDDTLIAKAATAAIGTLTVTPSR